MLSKISLKLLATLAVIAINIMSITIMAVIGDEVAIPVLAFAASLSFVGGVFVGLDI